jgi:hypothetical protein
LNAGAFPALVERIAATLPGSKPTGTIALIWLAET